MIQVNLSSLTEHQVFKRSRYSKVVWRITKRMKGGILIEALVSLRTTLAAGKTKVWFEEEQDIENIPNQD